MRQKLIDRLDGIIRFNKLTAGDLERIARIKLTEVVSRVAHLYGMTIDIAEEVFPWLARKAAGEGSGARGIARAVDGDVAGPLGSFMETNLPMRANRVRIGVVDDTIELTEDQPSG